MISLTVPQALDAVRAELQDTSEAQFAVGVTILDALCPPAFVGWGSVRFQRDLSGEGMATIPGFGQTTERVATSSAVRRLAAEPWPTLTCWARALSKRYVPPPPREQPQKPTFSGCATVLQYLRSWAKWQLELEEWYRPWCMPLGGYRLLCPCGIQGPTSTDHHAMIMASLRAGWAPHGWWRTSSAGQTMSGSLCPECVAYIPASELHYALALDTERYPGRHFLCAACGAHAPTREAVGWDLGKPAPPPPNRAHLTRKKIDVWDLCPTCKEHPNDVLLEKVAKSGVPLEWVHGTPQWR